MATKKTTIAAEIKVDTTGAEKEVQGLKDDIQGVGKATEGSIAQLKELKKELRNTAAGSEDFKRLSAQIRDLEDGIENAKVGANDFAGALENAGGPIGQLGRGFRQLEIVTSSWGAALKATGIGLIVSLVAGLTAAFASNENAMKKLQPLLTGLQKILGGIFRAMEPLLDVFIELATEALPYVTKGIGILYSSLIGLFTYIKEVGTGVAKFWKGIFTLDYKSIEEGVKQIGGSFGKVADSYNDSMKRFEEGTKELTATEKEEQAKRLADQKAHNEKLAAERKAALEKKIAEEQAEKERQAKERKEIEDFDLQVQQRLIQIEDENAAKELARQEKARADAKAYEDFDTQLQQRLLQVEQENAEKKKQADDAATKAKLDNLNAIGNATQVLGAIIGQQTTAGKALGVATALINTYTGASEVIRAKSVLPEPFGTIQKVASVASIIATGLKSVKSIMGVQVPSVKGSSGGGGAMPSIPSMNVSAPLSPTMATTTLNQAQVNQIGNVAARAYVVESDISGNQERIVRLNRAARIS